VPAVWLQPGSFGAEGLEFALSEFAGRAVGGEGGRGGGGGWCACGWGGGFEGGGEGEEGGEEVIG
jgi:hypothetical protein